MDVTLVEFRNTLKELVRNSSQYLMQSMTPDERSAFVSELFAGYCRECWRALKPGEQCHCTRDD